MPPHLVGYAPGVYDLFHIGHLNILRHARSQCDYLVAGVVSDDMAQRAKGRPPVIPLVERLEIVRSIRYVDAAIAEMVPDKTQMWHQLRFHRLFKGDDWRGTPKGTALEEQMGKLGVEVVYFPYTVHTSSTQLRGVLDTLSRPAAGSRAHHAAEPS
ncbi:adenylyltransferase/cytidyltransferase family protein [Streptomyces sp. YIM 98790]|uniref:adenylyltransferase/cytidyltransferase family protein n=1 Tax=Streptomyces sp. YIM 98790 TaxID=2689077 RepID=UPI00140AD62D|nr:adenylyltransferase/cytidyltransferase family protein [Streptomyces sp. YIM 98790]